MSRFQASPGWTASQNTYSLLLEHGLSSGMHNPFELIGQQGAIETEKPAIH